MRWRQFSLILGLFGLFAGLLFTWILPLSSVAQVDPKKTAPEPMPKAGGKGAKGKTVGPTPTGVLLDDVKGPPGFDVSIFARHPGMNYPTCMCATMDGKLFVGCDGESAQGTAPGHGKVVLVEDKDGDGVADSYTVFCTVEHPRGLLYFNGALYVNHPGDFSVFYDDDGDGKADREVLLVKDIAAKNAYSKRGADHSTNNITMGIDGWIYFAVGDQGMNEAVAVKDGAKLQMRSGICRIRPDGTGLEEVVKGTRNIYGIAIDPFMNLITRDNNNDGNGWGVRITHDIPTAEIGYPSLWLRFGDEILKPLADYGGGGPTGAIFLDEPSLPKPYDYACMTVDYGKNMTFRLLLEPKGATFKDNLKQEVFARNKNPIDLEYDGQGRLYLSSFYGAGFNYTHENTGYIARLTPTGKKPGSFPDLVKASDIELLGFLTGESATVRLRAQREILRRGEKEVFVKGLEKAASTDGPIKGRVAAAFTLPQLQGVKSYPFLEKLAQDKAMREFAIKLLADDKRNAASVPVKPIVDALSDPDPRVRVQAVIAVGRLGKQELAEKLIPRLEDTDAAIAHIAYRNLNILGAYETCLKALDSSSSPQVLLGCTFALQLMHETAVVDGLIEKLNQKKAPLVQQAAIRALTRLYFQEKPWDGTWWGTHASNIGPYFETEKWAQSDRIAEALSKAIEGSDTPALAYLLQESIKNNVPLANKTQLSLKLALSDAKYRPQAVALLVAQRDLSDEAITLLQKTAVEEKAKPALQAQAIRGLHGAAAKTKNYEIIVPVLAKLGPVNLSKEVLAARNAFIRDGALAESLDYFGKLTQDKDESRREVGYRVLLQVAGNFQLPPPQRNQAGKFVEDSWKSPLNTANLLTAIGNAEAEEYALQIKQYLNDPRPEVKAAAAYAAKMIDLESLEKASKSGSTVGTMKYEDIAAVVFKERGDPARGSRLFVKQGCVLCHTLSVLETPKGPFLADIGSKLKRDELLESILKPSAKLAQGYEPWQITLENGKILSGFIVRESGEEIELRNLGGISTVIRKSDIDTRVRGEVSIMPEGLASGLSVQDLTSLVAFLESQKTTTPGTTP